jgi:hypothetical protein
MRRILFIFLIPLAISASEIEEALIVNDSRVFEALVTELGNTNIPFQVVNTNQILYPIGSREEITSIKTNIFSRFYSDCGGKLILEGLQEKVTSKLNAMNIPHRVVTLDDGEWVVCPKEYRNEYKEVVRSVLGLPLEYE